MFMLVVLVAFWLVGVGSRSVAFPAAMAAAGEFSCLLEMAHCTIVSACSINAPSMGGVGGGNRWFGSISMNLSGGGASFLLVLLPLTTCSPAIFLVVLTMVEGLRVGVGVVSCCLE